MTSASIQESVSLPICSICIANYNGREVIDECLRSVFAQDCDLPFEVLVHDDASSDDSVEMICNSYPQVTLMVSDENVGFCISNNRMVARSTGKYVLLLNNDAVLYHDALSTLIGEAEKLTIPSVLGLPQYDYETGELLDIGSECDLFLNPIPNLNIAKREVAMVSGACLWIRRDKWNELGGFPGWFGSVAEDLYLCQLARLRAFYVQTLDTSGFRHHVGKALGGGRVTRDNHLVTSVRRRALSERNKSFVMILTYPAPSLLVIFPLHVTLLVVEGLTLAVIKRKWSLFENIYLACLRSLWQERQRLHYARKVIQADRLIGFWQFWSVFQLLPYKLRMLLRHGLPHLK